MPERSCMPTAIITVKVNGREVRLPQGATVAAALLNAQAPCRISESGQPRAALCGMGICFECRAVINGIQHQRTCQILCSDGMNVETQQ